METVDLSIVITNWNYAKYLRQAIASIEAQTVKPKEWYIVDDGSNDESHSIYNSLPPERVMRHASQKGCVAALQTALDSCTTEWIVNLAADNELDSRYVEKTWNAAVMEKVSWVYTYMLLIDEQGASLGIRSFRKFNYNELQRYNFIDGCALIRTNLIREAGGWKMAEHEDWDLWKRVAGLGERAALVKEPLLRYRKHGFSRGNGGRGM